MGRLTEIRNIATVEGKIVSGPCYSHTVRGERFYLADLSSKRLSGTIDTMHLMLSEALLDMNEDYLGRVVKAAGQFRSYVKHYEYGSALFLSLLVKELDILDDDTERTDINQIYLDGFISKVPVFRITPLGRKITDLFLAVNRPNGRSDYIPCVAWSGNARIAAKLNLASRIRICGRIQSRVYRKRTVDDDYEDRTTCEVSIDRLECVDDT